MAECEGGACTPQGAGAKPPAAAVAPPAEPSLANTRVISVDIVSGRTCAARCGVSDGARNPADTM
jgi:hypothetical protein